MFDIGVTKIAIIGGIALVVIGPEKLPGLARTIGTLLGRARRYVADVKAEVNRSMDLDELKNMRDAVVGAATEVNNSIHNTANELVRDFSDPLMGALPEPSLEATPSFPQYRRPQKNWRVKRSATPQWFKVRSGQRTKALSGAARVARFRPKSLA